MKQKVKEIETVKGMDIYQKYKLLPKSDRKLYTICIILMSITVLILLIASVMSIVLRVYYYLLLNIPILVFNITTGIRLLSDISRQYDFYEYIEDINKMVSNNEVSESEDLSDLEE